MFAVAAPPMPKSDEAFPYCTYASTKIDDQLIELAQAAALLTGRRTVQEYISEVVNAAVARDLNRKPIKRRPPPPKPKGKGRPPRKP